MNISVRALGYRCFGTHALQLDLRPGILALVGPNNSGKSAALRLFSDLRTCLCAFPANPQSVPEFCSTRLSQIADQNLPDPTEIFTQGRREDFDLSVYTQDFFVPSKPNMNCVNGFQIIVSRSVESAPLVTTNLLFGSNSQHKANPPFVCDALGHLSVKTANGILSPSGPFLDILPMRSIVEKLSRIFYISANRFIYGVRSEDPQYLFQMVAGKTLVEQWSLWQTGKNKEGKNVTTRICDDVQRLMGLSSLHIHATHDRDTLEIKTEHGSFRLDEVGSGISQLILILANAARVKPSWILIDEPEIGLHPSLQRDFLLTLATYAEHGVVFATHSLGLARGAADRVMVFKQKDGSTSAQIVQSNSDLRGLADALSFGWFDQLDERVILLVEGPTEVRVFDRWLAKLGKNHRVVIVHLGGESGIRPDPEPELKQLKQLQANIVAIVDSERDVVGADPKDVRVKFMAACKACGISCYLTDRPEIENYFTPSAIRLAFPGMQKTEIDPINKLRGTMPWGSKVNGYKVADMMTKEEILETDIGRILDDL